MLKGLSPLDAEGKLYMNYMDLMFQLKGKQKIHSFKHCFVEFLLLLLSLFWYV